MAMLTNKKKLHKNNPSILEYDVLGKVKRSIFRFENNSSTHANVSRKGHNMRSNHTPHCPQRPTVSSVFFFLQYLQCCRTNTEPPRAHGQKGIKFRSQHKPASLPLPPVLRPPAGSLFVLISYAINTLSQWWPHEIHLPFLVMPSHHCHLPLPGNSHPKHTHTHTCVCIPNLHASV